MKLEVAEITHSRQVTAELWDVGLRAPGIAREARPGQFIQVRVSETLDPLLRRPMSICRIGADNVDLLIRPAGRGSRILIEKGIGEHVDCLGPLGNGFAIHPSTRNLLMVAGGSGLGPMVALAEEAIGKRLSVTLLFGCQSEDRVYPASLLPAEVEYLVATDDGSVGHHGFVTDLMKEYLGWADAVYACGPRGMFLSMLEIARTENIRKSVQVSMEENMACGVGACFGCVVETRKGEMKSVCEDGPVFEMKELVWSR